VAAFGWAWWQAERPPQIGQSGESGFRQAPVAAPAAGPVRNLAAEARIPTQSSSTATGDDPGTESAEANPAPALATPARPEPAPEPTRNAALPSTADLEAQGISLPEMNLDIHVFSGNPAERFVFINASKYREGDRLRDGPRVVEITADGVILSHQGIKFLLPRD